MPKDRPTTRVLAMLELLQDRPGIRGPELAERLGVDERTVRRYAAHLADLGIPITAERGRYGGYRLPPRFRLPPLTLTDGEATAIVLGLLAGHPLGRAAGSIETALAKISRALPDGTADRVAALRSTLAFTPPPGPGSAPEPRIALDLAEAARDHRRLNITYRSWRGETSERDLDPYGLVLHADRWYVTGLDSRRAEIRVFRIDRIHSLRPAAEPDATSPPEGFDPAARVAASLGEMPGTHPVQVVLHTTLDQVARRIPPAAATLTPIADGILLNTRAARFDTMATYLAGLGCPFTVHHPAELRDALTRLSDRLATYAGRIPPP